MKANQRLASKTETTIDMNWSSDSTVDYLWYSINDGSSWTGVSVTDGKGGSYTISGLLAGTSYNIKTRLRSKASQLTTDSSVLSVTTYDYPYCDKAPNLTIGNKLTLGFYNPLNRSITVNILGADNSQISDETTTGTSISGFNDANYKERWYASIPNAKKGNYKVKVTCGSNITTKTGGVYSVDENDCSPSITSFSYADVSPGTISITGNDQQIIRTYSSVKYTATGLTAKNSATIASCKVTVNANSYNMTINGTTATAGNYNINSSKDVTATLTLTDSRGLTAKKVVNVTMIDYVKPSALITCQRKNNYYNETTITVNGVCSSLDGRNSLRIRVRYKLSSASSYGSYTTMTNNVPDVFDFDNAKEWDVQVLISDRFSQVTYTVHVPKGVPIIFFDTNLSSVGVNCLPQKENSFEVGGYDLNYSSDNCTISSGWASYGNTAAPVVFRQGRVVHFNWECNPTSSVTLNTNQVTVCTIPSGYRPRRNIYLLCQCSGTSFFCLSVLTTGAVKVSRLRDIGSNSGVYTVGTSSMWFPLSATWVI